MALATCNLLNRYVVTTEPWNSVHLLALRETLSKSQLPGLVIAPGEDLCEFFVISIYSPMLRSCLLHHQ